MGAKSLLVGGLISIGIGLVLLLFVMFYYPTGESSWGGVGVLLISVIFGLLGLLLLLIGLLLRLREKRMEKL
ncbi:hypothetical protein ACI2JA_10990 [Alkalihalobacillus sp. NPDC078783]